MIGDMWWLNLYGLIQNISQISQEFFSNGLVMSFVN